MRERRELVRRTRVARPFFAPYLSLKTNREKKTKQVRCAMDLWIGERAGADQCQRQRQRGPVSPIDDGTDAAATTDG